MKSAVRLSSPLLRVPDRMQHSQEGPHNGSNPYGLPREPGEAVHLCMHDLYNRMTTEAMMALFLNYLLADRVRPHVLRCQLR